MKSSLLLKPFCLFSLLIFSSFVRSNEFDINTFEILESTNNSVGKIGIYGKYGSIDEPRVVVFDDSALEKEQIFRFPTTIEKEKVFFISDKNGDGVEDVAFFGKHKLNGRYQLFVKNGMNAEQLLGKYNWPIKWQDAKILDVDDVNGDGIRDVGLYAINTLTRVPQISVYSGVDDSEGLGVFSFPKGRTNKQIELLNDINADSVDEYGLFSITKKDKPVLFIRSGSDPNVKIEQYNWPANWVNEIIVKLPDITGDEVGEIGLFGKRKDDGRWQLHAKNGLSRKGVENIYSWPASFENVTFHEVEDMTADGISEFAVLGYNVEGEKWQLQIKSGVDRSLVSNITWSGDFIEPEIFAISDINDNGTIDFALVGKRKESHAFQVQIKDGINSDLINTININDLSRAFFRSIVQREKTTLNVVGIKGSVPVSRVLQPSGILDNAHQFEASFVNKYVSGLEVHDYSSSSYITIGEGDYAISLDFSGRNGNSVYFYNDYNDGVDISYGAEEINQINDATKYSYQGRTVEPVVNSSESVVVAKNAAGFYASVQVLDVRDNGWDGKVNSVVFEWAIRKDGGTDFSSFQGRKGVSLVKCEEPGFFNSGGCQLVSTPYMLQESRSVQQSPRPQSFVLADFTLISHQNDLVISNLVALDLNGNVTPTFSEVAKADVLPKSHSRSFTLSIPPTGFRSARPFFELEVALDEGTQTLLQYSGRFSSN